MLDQNDLNAMQNLLSQALLENNKHINEQFKEIKSDIKEIKSDIKELHNMDLMILDEVERVHGIFEKKTEELEKKIG